MARLKVTTNTMIDSADPYPNCRFCSSALKVYSAMGSVEVPGAKFGLEVGGKVAAFALQQLGHLIGESRYLAAAERAVVERGTQQRPAQQALGGVEAIEARATCRGRPRSVRK